MAEAKIVSHLGEGQYSVLLHNDVTNIDLQKTKLQGLIDANNIKLAELKASKVVKQAELTAAIDAFKLAATVNKWCLYNNDNKLDKCADELAEVNSTQAVVFTKQQELEKIETSIDTCEVLKLRYDNNLNILNNDIPPEFEPMDIWCLDLADGIEQPEIAVDTLVSTIDIYNFTIQAYERWISPATYGRDPAYVLTAGKNASSLSSNGYGFIFNWNMIGPTLAWNPSYRVATITSINSELGTAVVSYSDLTDELGVNYNNPEYEPTTDIRFDYMKYGYESFRVNDKVIISFCAVKMDSPLIIGFYSNPRGRARKPALTYTRSFPDVPYDPLYKISNQEGYIEPEHPTKDRLNNYEHWEHVARGIYFEDTSISTTTVTTDENTFAANATDPLPGPPAKRVLPFRTYFFINDVFVLEKVDGGANQDASTSQMYLSSITETVITGHYYRVFIPFSVTPAPVVSFRTVTFDATTFDFIAEVDNIIDTLTAPIGFKFDQVYSNRFGSMLSLHPDTTKAIFYLDYDGGDRQAVYEVDQTAVTLLRTTVEGDLPTSGGGGSHTCEMNGVFTLGGESRDYEEIVVDSTTVYPTDREKLHGVAYDSLTGDILELTAVEVAGTYSGNTGTAVSVYSNWLAQEGYEGGSSTGEEGHLVELRINDNVIQSYYQGNTPGTSAIWEGNGPDPTTFQLTEIGSTKAHSFKVYDLSIRSVGFHISETSLSYSEGTADPNTSDPIPYTEFKDISESDYYLKPDMEWVLVATDSVYSETETSAPRQGQSWPAFNEPTDCTGGSGQPLVCYKDCS